MSSEMMPMMLLLLDRSALAAMLGWYPSSLAAMRTFFATPSLTLFSLLFIT